MHRLTGLLIVWCIASTFAAGPAFGADAGGAVTLYVSPAGRDAWSGTRGDPAADGADGPFATVSRAMEAVRGLRRQGGDAAAAKPVTVYLRGGTHVLAQPLVLTPGDSGTADAPLTFAAHRDEVPVVSGGRRVGPWRVERDGAGRDVWVASIPPMARTGAMRELWVDGARRTRARHPNVGYLPVAGVPEKKAGDDWTKGVASFAWRGDDLRAWLSARQAEAVVMSRWVESRMPVAGIDPDKRVISFTRKSVFELAENDLYYLEGAADFLDSPGEWCADLAAGTIRYLPRPGEDPAKVEAVVPALTELVRLDGKPEAGRHVEHVAFRGIAFAHATTDVFDARTAPSGFVQAAHGVGGAIRAVGARRVTFDGCAVRHVGGYAIDLGRGCQEVAVTHCTLTDLGAGGVKVGGTQIRAAEAEQTFGNRVVDCRIADGGRTFHSAVGVWIGQARDNVIAHCEIADLYYTGISIGWTWGYGPSGARGNVVEHNHVHHVGRRSDGDGPILSDMGFVYTLGTQPGTVIRNNRMHDAAGLKYGGWGIYFDEGSSQIVAERNLVYRTVHGGLHQHYGRDNVVRNNIFVDGQDRSIERSRPEEHRSFTVERNIVVWKSGVGIAGNWTGPHAFNAAFDRNLYWPHDKGEPRFGYLSWDDWRAKGMDAGSVIADPLFVDLAKDDFRLKPDSPALKLGFEPFDANDVGPRPRK